MKTKQIILTSALVVLSSALVMAAPLGTAFTYQGRLADGGNPANGSYDLTFTLYDDASGGTAVAGPLTNNPVGVNNGLFTVPLDFGAGVFTGDARWLEIGVRSNGVAADFTVLSPRQPLTPTPYALYAPTAGSADSVLAANITGTVALAQLPAAIVTNKQSGVTFQDLFLGEDYYNGGYTALHVGLSETYGGYSYLQSVRYSGTEFGDLILNASAGNVGIGTATPTAKLEVAGTVKATAFIGDGSGLTALSPNVALLNNSQTFSGAKTFSANVTAMGSLRLNGLLRPGSETGAAFPFYPANPDGSTGLVIRRITSSTSVSNSVVARTDQLTLVRDGTASGLNIVFAPGAGIATINATGITRAGNVVTRVLSTFSPPLWTVVFSDSQKVVHYDITFGDIYDVSHTCHVVLDRYDDGVDSDWYLVGTLTSTYNQ